MISVININIVDKGVHLGQIRKDSESDVYVMVIKDTSQMTADKNERIYNVIHIEGHEYFEKYELMYNEPVMSQKISDDFPMIVGSDMNILE